MDKYIKFSDLLEYLRSRNDEARRCGHEETYFDLLTIIDGLKNVDTVPASALDKDINVPSKWIPVSERMPEKDGIYLVSGGGKVWSAQCLTFGCFRGWSNDVRNPAVIAWMPLPEPYKEQPTCGPDYCEIGGTHDE